MNYKNFQNKKYLIVDDFLPFRRSLKDMLKSLGGIDIDMAADAKEALDHCDDKNYDAILSDYNLGEGMDGQELHEELVYRDKVKPQTLFLMVTAEDSAPMVISSVVTEPDAYMTKPFGQPELKLRLLRGFETKYMLKVIHIAMEVNADDRAVELCDYIMEKSPRYTNHCLKLKSYLLMKNKKYDEAQQLFDQINKDTPMPWALLGQGKLHFNKENYDHAKYEFTNAIKHFGYFLPAYDWLAQTLEKLGDTQGAQEILTKAIRISPRNVERQLELARLAEINGDEPTRLKAFRSAVKYAKNTRHKNADNYVKLANGICEMLKDGSSMKDRALMLEAQKSLKKVKYEFHDATEDKVRAGLGLANLLDKSGKKIAAENQRKESLEKAEEIDSFERPETFAEVAQGYIKDGNEERAQELLNELKEKHPEEKLLHNKHLKLFRNKNVVQMKEIAAEHNEEGVHLFKQGDLSHAARLFMQASDELPEDPSYSLNAVQVLIDLARKDKDEHDISNVHKYLERIKLDEDDHRLDRFHKLQSLASKL